MNPLEFNAVDADMSHMIGTLSLLEGVCYELNIFILQLNL